MERLAATEDRRHARWGAGGDGPLAVLVLERGHDALQEVGLACGIVLNVICCYVRYYSHVIPIPCYRSCRCLPCRRRRRCFQLDRHPARCAVAHRASPSRRHQHLQHLRRCTPLAAYTAAEKTFPARRRARAEGPGRRVPWQPSCSPRAVLRGRWPGLGARRQRERDQVSADVSGEPQLG